MNTCAVCKQKIKDGETFSKINETLFYHTNGFCDTIVVEKLIDEDGKLSHLNESLLEDLEEYEMI